MACAAGVRLAGAEELLGLGHRHREHLADVAAAEVVVQHQCLEPLPLALLAGGGDAGHHRQVGVDDAGALQFGQAPSELALNSAGFTPLAFANASMVRVLVTRERLVPTDDPA
jgi:hypothetical protein